MIRSRPTATDLPGPPPEVLDEVAAALERSRTLGELRARLDLRVRSGRRVCGELALDAGGPVERLGPLELLALGCGVAPRALCRALGAAGGSTGP